MKNSTFVVAVAILSVAVIGCGSAEIKSPPCAVDDNGDGTFTISCSNGTSVVVSNGKDGADGADGKDGASCTVSEPTTGTRLITCDDGTSVSVRDGAQGPTGASCTVVDNGNGTSTVGCEDGTSAVLHDGELCEVTPNAEGTLVIISCPDDYVVEGSAIIEGNVEARDSVTLALIRNYSRITGNLTISGVTNVSLPNLVEVGGYININQSESTETIDLHSLVSIAEYPILTGFTGLRIWENPNLQSVDLSSLSVVGPGEPPTLQFLEVRIEDNPHLPSCWADALIARITTIGDTYQSGNDDAATCD